MENKPFRIGLCMAGAVSAGAYTAGVMDYLIEALEEWEKRRGNAGVPSHKVTIPIMGGASAGGMTALLTASTLNNTITPVPLPKPGQLLTEHPENKLYHSWVDLTAVDMFPKMLDTSDIQSGKIISLLNSNFIDEIADKMISSDIAGWKPTPVYFEEPVKVFVTLTNLEGFSYYAGFNDANRKSKYYMSLHNDYACFELYDDNQNRETSSGWMPLNFKTAAFLKTAKDAAMATGAFPIGLKSRLLEREPKYVNTVSWLKEVFTNTPLDPLQPVKTLHVDGGMINNEPFEKVRDLLDEIFQQEYKKENPDSKEEIDPFEQNCDYNTFENTVVMIDPFPSVLNEKFDFSQDLLKVIPKTLSAMTAQMRAKKIHFRKAMKEQDGSRFIISPSRNITDEKTKQKIELFGEKAIACGTLSGFGGFLSKEFRIHDYYLGRYNCEVFLRDYFTIPAEALEKNPIFAKGYESVDAERYSSMATGEKRYQILPIFNSDRESDVFPMPVFSSGTNWPMLRQEDIDRLNKPIKERIQKLLLNISDLSKLNSFFVWAGAKIVLNRLLSGKVMKLIKDSLHEWDLIKNYKP